ncbi:site-specific integrase [Fibrella forsythiae]|uniref:Tyrosine-type recombinase/integrase n=1 Tax=Fibrella forsythiae TaxID=2817061 RepID=A0ABS3JLN1_9BACT|nr:site-specific integrase [Fibrella forsythiae]MBO0950919.1 tyrosine-type recombinase/integrase [Fibrella forsythiae]
MNKIKFTLTESRKTKSGEYPIYMRFNHGDTELVYPTGEKCKLAEWDKDKEKFRRSMAGYQQANEYLQLLRERLTNTYRDLRNDGLPITNDTLRAGLNASKSPVAVEDVATRYEQYRLQCKNEGYKESTIKSMGSTTARLLRWQRSKGKVYITHYTNAEHKSFLKFLDAEGLHPNTIGCVCKHLATFFNALRLNGHKLHPQQAKISSQKIDTERIWLNELELEKLERAELPDHLSRTRDAFLFQCWTGLRYSDLRRITNANIQPRGGYDVLTFIPEKSVSRKVGRTKSVEVPILPKAARVLGNYTEEYRLLPVLSNQKMNDNLKEIAKLAGISQPTETLIKQNGHMVVKAVPKWSLLSSHIARHTYATLSIVKGIPLEVVSKALGHSRLQTTMVYAKIADEWKNRLILDAWK